MIHEHVQQLPGLRLIVPEPEYPDDHDGVVPGAGFVEVFNVQLGTTRLCQELAFSYMMTIWGLTVRTTQGNSTVTTSRNNHFMKSKFEDGDEKDHHL